MDEKYSRIVKRGGTKFHFLTFLLVFFGMGYLSENKGPYFSITEEDIDPKKVILDALETNLAGNWSKKYTAEPHLAGTNYGLVKWTEDKFSEYGFETTIDPYEIYVSYPKDHDLNLVNSTGDIIYKAPLKEDTLKKDPTTKGNDTIPTFLGYAANGNVTAEYVYANYGTREDFALLKENKVNITGKIAIVRYGKIFRGLKVKFAQDNGAVGVLLYSDPGDDFGITPANGFKQYPKGPARQESSVQRGSVQFLGGIGSAPGDPTTPGYPSKPGATRQDPHTSIGKIPALPISYREVKPILAKLNGQGKKIKGFEGELEGFKYYTGPNSNYTLNLYNDQIYNITTMWNVYGEIKGEKTDEVIIIGNHRDAWIKGGAGDPNSGSAVLLEVARALGELKKAGYKFKRTIVLHSYDGEEYGLLGSTEQGEFFADKYQREVIAYLNLDVAVSGKHFKLGSSPVLNKVLLEIAKELVYPEEGVGSLYDHYVKAKGGEHIPTLGSGSDYTVYLEHLGIPSVDLGFQEGKGDPIYHYHSNYDSYYWISEFADKGFVYHNLAAKYLALLTLGLSEPELINFGLQDYSKGLLSYLNTTVARIPKDWLSKPIKFEDEYNWKDSRYITKVTNGFYEFKRREGKCRIMRMMHHSNRTLEKVINKTFENLHSLNNSTISFDSQTAYLQKKFDEPNKPFWQRIRLHYQIKYHNKYLQYFERNFLHREGLHERPWFKHIIFASGRYTGYAGQNLPGLNEAIEDGDFDRFVKWLHIVSKTAKRVSSRLRN
ncbi:putative glutamate carboxypeptidase [Spathaspora sp. JA1]|nr:putative glutamate carboxypeptidase [Spathaspora sp. JA1]